MAVLSIENSFVTDNKSVYDYLNTAGLGLYIPLYQREYSWDTDNIEQLLEDITRGIQRVATGEVRDDKKEIRFLGTLITVNESNRNNIYPIDPQGVPSRVEKVIDGQQRVSTIALMATLLVSRLAEINKKANNKDRIKEEVQDICDSWIAKLFSVFSLELNNGQPKRKPKIVRGAIDYWTKKGNIEDAYKSELSLYLARFIGAYENGEELPSLSKDGNAKLYANAKVISNWLKNEVANAHDETKNYDFATGSTIIGKFPAESLWDYERQELNNILEEHNFSKKTTEPYIVSELLQTIAVCHYLLDRCCFTIIQPTDDDWAFDMFQSLNATGTPLTAIETFKPTVVNTANNTDGQQYKNSTSDKYFQKIEDFLSVATNAQQKNKRTNDFLTSFFVAYDGRTMSTHFSYQRKALESAYSECNDFTAKESFVKHLGNYAQFYGLWTNYSGKENGGVVTFPGLESASDSDLASMLLLFLKGSKHKMAITALAEIYDNVIEGSADGKTDFIRTVKAISAFYYLWRSSASNSGLDTSYRDFFRRNKGNRITSELIVAYINEVLEKKGIATKDKWIAAAKGYLKYDTASNDVIRLGLLIAAHNTIPDESHKGLVKYGRDHVAPYLSLEKWLSDGLKTIEHVAPQKNDSNLWDAALYDDVAKAYQSIGNLTLLPQDLNSSVGNKGWKEKLLYYQCVAETDPEQLAKIKETANEQGISLSDSTVNLLKDCIYNSHLKPISGLYQNDAWNKEMVENRTENILSIIWDRISPWLK